MRIWLWDVASDHGVAGHRGVTDDQYRARRAAQDRMRDGDTARVEMAIAIVGFRELTSYHHRTGVAWTARSADGTVTWTPAGPCTEAS